MKTFETFMDVVLVCLLLNWNRYLPTRCYHVFYGFTPIIVKLNYVKNISSLFNPFFANVPILYPLKTPGIYWFSAVLRVYKVGPLA